jgi:proteasome lid subunit RPN8/RPN11
MDGRNCKRRVDLQKIILPQTIKKILTQHAKSENPNESCAILYGNGNIVSDVFLTNNIEQSPVNFTISNEQLIEGYKIAEEKKMDVVGIFHSHPNSEAYPSNTDKKFMHSNPVAWIIYSGINQDFKAYVLESDILEIPIQD